MNIGHYLLVPLGTAEVRTSYCGTDMGCYKVVLFIT